MDDFFHTPFLGETGEKDRTLKKKGEGIGRTVRKALFNLEESMSREMSSFLR